MTSISYICALYRFAYDYVGLAHQDLIRYHMNNWWEYLIGADEFHDVICNALSTDTKAKKFYGF